MNQFTTFVDVAGRVSRSTQTFHRVTGAGVVVPGADVDRVRRTLPADAPKWGASDFAQTSNMVDWMIDNAVAVGAFTVNKRTPAWEKYWVDSAAIEQKIRRQDGKAAGFVRAANFLRFHLMGGAAGVAFGHAHFRTQSKSRIVDHLGRHALGHDVVFDNDIQGDENEEMLRIMMSRPMPRSERYFNFTVERRMSLATEQDEPLLLVADVAAGLVHAAHLPEADLHLPLSQARAIQLLERLDAARMLAIHGADFNIDCSEVFGELADGTRTRAASPAP